MSRRTHACLGCADSPGDTPFNKPRRTRHKNQVCSVCRRQGIKVHDGQLIVPIQINYKGRAA